MANNLTLRPARESDLDTLAQFGAALAAQHRGYDTSRFLSPPEEEFFDFFSKHLNDPSALLTIAEDVDGPLGYAFVRWEPPSFVDLAEEAPWLHDLYVLPRARSRGVGKALIQHAAAYARKRGATCLRLEVSPKNGPGIHAFENSGFRTTMLEMQLDLPS